MSKNFIEVNKINNCFYMFHPDYPDIIGEGYYLSDSLRSLSNQIEKYEKIETSYIIKMNGDFFERFEDGEAFFTKDITKSDRFNEESHAHFFALYNFTEEFEILKITQ